MVLAGCIASTGSLSASTPRAVGGTIDLRDWDFEREGTVRLAGEWLWYWDALLSPAQLDESAGNAIPATGTFEMPATWNGAPTGDGPAGGRGFATFTLDILLPRDMQSAALLVPNASTAYRLWLDGERTLAEGTVGTTAESSVPYYRVRRVDIAPAGDGLSLVLQVSNFHHRRGGMWKPMILGTPDQIEAVDTAESTYDLALLGGFLLMALYNVVLYLADSERRRAPLVLGLMFALLAIRVPLLGQILVTRLMPATPWVVTLKLEYLTANWTPFLFVASAHLIHPKSLPRPFLLGFLVFALVNSGIVIVASVLFYSRIILLVLLVIQLALLSILVWYIALFWRGRRELWVIIAGFVLLLLTIFGETAHYREWILSRDFAPFGFMIRLIAPESTNETPLYLFTTTLTFILFFIVNTLLMLRVSRTLPAVHAPHGLSQPTPPIDLDTAGLTKREREIVHLAVTGLSNKEIAAELYISEGTVKVHLHKIMGKLEVRNRTELSHRVSGHER